jgi:hypothetical protein
MKQIIIDTGKRATNIKQIKYTKHKYQINNKIIHHMGTLIERIKVKIQKIIKQLLMFMR